MSFFDFGYRSKAMQSKEISKQFGEFVYVTIEDNDYFNRARVNVYFRSCFFSNSSCFTDLEQIKQIIKNLKKAKRIALKPTNKETKIGKDIKVVPHIEGYDMLIQLKNDLSNSPTLTWDVKNFNNIDTLARNFTKALKFIEATVKGRRLVTNAYERVDR